MNGEPRDHADPLAKLAHELRNSLAVISGYAELLRLRHDEQTTLDASECILEAVRRSSRALDAAVGGRPAPAELRPTAVYRIALIEDEEPLRRLLRATLLPSEYDVVEAPTGDDALTVCARTPPDLVILDWNLPGRSGAEVLRELKRSWPGLPVILLTADSRADASSADALLRKPFSPVELLDLIERLLARPVPKLGDESPARAPEGGRTAA